MRMYVHNDLDQRALHSHSLTRHTSPARSHGASHATRERRQHNSLTPRLLLNTLTHTTLISKMSVTLSHIGYQYHWARRP